MSDKNAEGAVSPVLVIDKLRKQYRNLVAVDDLSFNIYPGEFVGFIGPNGAGKSSTIRSIVGLQLPDSGTVTVAGHDVKTSPLKVRAAIGYVPQEMELYQYLTGEELLRFVGEVREVPPEDLERRISELIALCELENAKGRLIREYSGGMARKISLAVALVAEPPLLLLDESFVGMDPESTYRLRRYLQAYTQRGGAVLLSSHILDMLERICTRVVIINKGKLVADESMKALEAKFKEGTCQDLTHFYLTSTGQSQLLEEWD